jgi:hypothetical protein
MSTVNSQPPTTLRFSSESPLRIATGAAALPCTVRRPTYRNCHPGPPALLRSSSPLVHNVKLRRMPRVAFCGYLPMTGCCATRNEHFLFFVLFLPGRHPSTTRKQPHRPCLPHQRQTSCGSLAPIPARASGRAGRPLQGVFRGTGKPSVVGPNGSTSPWHFPWSP